MKYIIFSKTFEENPNSENTADSGILGVFDGTEKEVAQFLLKKLNASMGCNKNTYLRQGDRIIVDNAYGLYNTTCGYKQETWEAIPLESLKKLGGKENV